MKNKRTIAALFLILAMTLMLALAGCGSQSQPEEPAADEGEEGNLKGTEIHFTTTDIEGNEVSMEDYKDAKLILINLWEPWCSPCVKEMPSLQALYEKYRDQGFLVLGVFSDIDDEDGARDVIEQNGITYPILHSCDEIQAFESNYVPTSYFTDGNGVILHNGPLIGSMSESAWEAQIKKYLSR